MRAPQEQLPRRESLVAQTAEILRRQIGRRAYRGRLPGERALCERLQVSRPTLRAALGLLEREGLLHSQPRRGHALTASVPTSAIRRASHVIGFLASSQFDLFSPSNLLVYRGIEQQLRTAGYEVDVRVLARSREDELDRRLRTMVNESRASSWLLCSVPRAVQQWFQRQRIPTLVSATCFDGVELPWMDVDYRAVCRHAAQTFLGLGHRRIAFLTPRAQFAGDVRSEEGFLEAFVVTPSGVPVHGSRVGSKRLTASLRTHANSWQAGSSNEIPPLILRHDGSADSIRALLRTHCRGARAVTALLVAHSQHALTAASYLLIQRRQVPADVSLICRDHDEFLAHFTPAIARYEFDWSACAKRFTRALIQLAMAGTLKTQRTLLMPRFVRTDSVGPVSRNERR